jgi:hypothetical protein
VDGKSKGEASMRDDREKLIALIREAQWSILLTPSGDIPDQDGPGDYVRGGVMMTVAGIDLAPVREVEKVIHALPPHLRRLVSNDILTSAGRSPK